MHSDDMNRTSLVRTCTRRPDHLPQLFHTLRLVSGHTHRIYQVADVASARVAVQNVMRHTTRFRLIDDEAMLREPDQEYLIERVCSVGSLVLMHGLSGAGKSFVGVDVAFSVASGRPWHDHAVKQGPVVYIAAEGQGGFKDRIRAWKTGHRMETGRVLGVNFILEPVDPLDPNAVGALLTQLKTLDPRPTLSIVDTWSASLGVGGGNENDTKDTSQAVAAWRRVIAEVGTSVWIIHHQGHNAPDRARGNSALKAAAETEIAVRQEKGSIILIENKKQRDGTPFDNIRFKMHVVPLGDGRDSCILVPASASATITASTPIVARDQTALDALRLLAPERGGEHSGVTYSVWLQKSGQKSRTFDRAIKALCDAEYVTKQGDGKGALYVPTDRHRHLTATSPSVAVAARATITVANRHTPIGGGGGGGSGGDLDGAASTATDQAAAAEWRRTIKRILESPATDQREE